MAITFVLLNGDKEVVENYPQDSTCQDYVIEQQIVELPPDKLDIQCEGQRVNDERLGNYEGKKLVLLKQVVA